MNEIPSMDNWLREAKADESLPKTGMYLIHNGIVRSTPKALVRYGDKSAKEVLAMDFSYDEKTVREIEALTLKMDGIFYLRYWLNQGILNVGDDMMYVLVGGDIRSHVVDALQFFVSQVKDRAVKEIEIS